MRNKELSDNKVYRFRRIFVKVQGRGRFIFRQILTGGTKIDAVKKIIHWYSFHFINCFPKRVRPQGD